MQVKERDVAHFLEGFVDILVGNGHFRHFNFEVCSGIGDADWDTAKSEMIAGQLFARFAPQGGLDVAIGWADNQTAAIIRAAEAAHIPLGTEKGKLIVLGMNCNRDGIQAIKDGREIQHGNPTSRENGREDG